MNKNKFDFSNKTAVITGGAQGFGLDIAKRFLDSGAKVVIWDIDSKLLDKVINDINNTNLSSNVVDVSVYKEVEDTVNKILNKTDIDILINNAGITQDNLAIRMKDDEWNKVLDINLTSTFFLSKNVLKKMLKNKNGKIINVTSVVGHTGNIGQTNYTASKSGLIGMSKSLALEYGKKNIKINCISPGFIKSDMTDKISENYKEILKEKIPLARFGVPNDVANAVIFLSSSMADYITGETIHVNGGMYFS